MPSTSNLFKFSVLSVLLNLVAAQDIPNIPNLPACAQGCAADTLKASGCDASDAVCQCSDTTSGGLGFVNGIVRCSAFAGCTYDANAPSTYDAVHAYCDNALKN